MLDLDIAENIFAGEHERLVKYNKRYGGYWRFPKMLDFCYLVNPYFPPKRMKDEIRANFDVRISDELRRHISCQIRRARSYTSMLTRSVRQREPG